jgi:hypothetical protein
VDTPPQAPTEYSPERQRRQAQLSKLREPARVVTADIADHQFKKYLVRHGMHQQFAAHDRVPVRPKC